MAEKTQSGLRVQLQSQLQEERERLQGQLKELSRGGDASLSFDDGFADSSQVTAERGEIEALSGRLTDMLRDIDDALAKMDDDTYGKCESCGGEISEARLEAMPAARLCITCASKSR